MKKSVKHSLLMAVAVLTMAGAGIEAQEAQSPNLEQGRKSYFSAGCHHCHGGVGQGARGPTMAAIKYPFEAFQVFVRKPIGGGMPPYSETQMPDAELRAIYAYLVSLPGPASELPELLR